MFVVIEEPDPLETKNPFVFTRMNGGRRNDIGRLERGVRTVPYGSGNVSAQVRCRIKRAAWYSVV